MTYKWIGACMILAGCGGTGFSMAARDKREELLLRQLASSLGYMASRLEYRLIPLPQLCRETGTYSWGSIRALFFSIAEKLECYRYPQASDCMNDALSAHPELPGSLRAVFRELGRSLGQLDLPGQLQGLENAQALCVRKLKRLEHNRDQRLRSYQTLSLCAGAALAILLI